MANTDNPRGARPARHLNGGNIVANSYAVDASNSTSIFPGDAMILEADGNVAPYTGTGGGNLIGFCAGVDGDFDNLSRRYLPASTAGTVFIWDDPDQTFEIQTAGTITADDAGNNADVTATAGATSSSMSRHEVSATTGTGTAQLRLIRPSPREDNDVTAANSDWEVRINEHALRSTTGV